MLRTMEYHRHVLVGITGLGIANYARLITMLQRLMVELTDALTRGGA